jgi:hypothetical protein
MAFNPVRRKFTVYECHALGRAGILGEDDRRSNLAILVGAT